LLLVAVAVAQDTVELGPVVQAQVDY